MNPLIEALSVTQGDMKVWRHHLHRHPELAFEEF